MEDGSLTTLFRDGHPRKVLNWDYFYYISTAALNTKKAQKSNVFYVITVFMTFYIFMYFVRYFHHILSLTALVSTQRMSLFIIGAVF